MKKYTMAKSGGRYSFLDNAVRTVLDKSVSGDFVECGVWRGGNCMLMASILKEYNEDRTVWMYDTYEGMPKPTKHDVFHNVKKAKAIWYDGWCRASYDEVEENMGMVGYPNYKMIKGLVQDTIPNQVPEEISILRLDTDFYESTKHELKHLYPLLVKGGVLIVDDYGSWQGSKKAVDEYGLSLTQIGTSNAYYRTK